MSLKMRRWVRPENDRKIAGVCAGLGDFFSVDPVVFRFVFLILAFLKGVGILIYILAWILVPEDSETASVSFRRLTLSTTDRKIAGVCGGLGEYFRMDPVFFRIAFSVAAFWAGVGILVYILLWLLLPKDSTVPHGF